MRNFLLVVFILCSQWAIGQQFKASNGMIKFYSEEILENITAVNNKVKSIFDSKTGEIVFSVPIDAFIFDKPLMREHFNEKYLESEKYPKSTFKGKITSYKIDEKNPKVWAEGELAIHGVKQQIKIAGSLDYIDNKVIIHSIFFVKLVDYNITVPQLMFQKIAEEIEVTINIEYNPYEK